MSCFLNLIENTYSPVSGIQQGTGKIHITRETPGLYNGILGKSEISFSLRDSRFSPLSLRGCEPTKFANQLLCTKTIPAGGYLVNDSDIYIGLDLSPSIAKHLLVFQRKCCTRGDQKAHTSVFVDRPYPSLRRFQN